MYAPPVVDKQIEDGQRRNQEESGPFRLESDRDHDTRRQSHDRHHRSRQRKLAVEDEAEKEKDEEDPSGELEVFLAIRFVDLECWQSGPKVLLLR